MLGLPGKEFDEIRILEKNPNNYMFFIIAGVCLHYLQLRDLPSLILDCLVMESTLMDMWSMMTIPYRFGCKEELFQIHVMLGNLTHLYEFCEST